MEMGGEILKNLQLGPPYHLESKSNTSYSSWAFPHVFGKVYVGSFLSPINDFQES